MPYRSEGKVIPSRSVLLCFSSTILPSVVEIGYLRFRTRVYNPPPKRCYNCNRYGHLAKHCRSARRCTKCGDRHGDEACKRGWKCVNCGGNHSAAYKGCPRFRFETRVNSIMATNKVNYWTARQMLNEVAKTPDVNSFAEFPQLSTSQNPKNLSRTYASGKSSTSIFKSFEPTIRDYIPKRVADKVSSSSIDGQGTRNETTKPVSVSASSFYKFLVTIIQSTLDSVMQGKQVNIESIVAKSIEDKLGISASWCSGEAAEAAPVRYSLRYGNSSDSSNR